MSTSDTATNCPFCGFIPAGGEYGILLHIETHHAESPSPFVAAEESILCPHGGCGELVSPDELPYHLELHGLEEGEEEGEEEPAVEVAAVAAVAAAAATTTTTAAESTEPPESERSSRSSRPTRESSSRSRKSAKRPTGTIQAWRDLFEGHRSRQTRDSSRRTRHKSKTHVDTKSSEPAAPASATAVSPAQAAESSQQFARLGKSELGRYAHEKEMPDWLVSLLKHEGQVVNKGIMPVLAQLLEQSPSTQYAYLCHRHVQHISKLRREGGFCGYRNIQMLTSHVIGARSAGAEKFGSTFPSIFQVQDLIENAWDMGYNAQGRIETGGIKGTRKYIGTPEAQAVFCSLGIPCTVQAFKDRERGKAKSHLLQAVEQYFQGGVEDPEDRIHLTKLPPIYLQHPGHSLTIVGFEKQMDGRANLLVFDPSFRDSVTIRNLVGRFFRHKPAIVGETLDPYRRGSSYLRRFNAFEVLFLTSTATD